jgi:hypothetical protein
LLPNRNKLECLPLHPSLTQGKALFELNFYGRLRALPTNISLGRK